MPRLFAPCFIAQMRACARREAGVPATGFMTGKAGRTGEPMRRLCGWLDVDAYPFVKFPQA